ncbi:MULTISPECIES: type 1 glutamine amidotransferase [Methanosarcina]|uniref:Glutamine amidotransferase class-I n=4 Tax=Methanosarcina barkeri TaxID=2208 RepID=A0A0E3LN49_METBA|nr:MULTISPECIES: type 1 glutamine amidotransferase [Methanosarcina]AKB54151.1 Glutamine amidotransferase class-I [Methanosarcina barkeri MS]AKB57773.1 Glutamine amidotransferase class-I [Methanosarcina barkeri 227]AKJ38317.1 glutamine amidotransferase [Methanosarcina barkeri CM1]OEC91564.1 amidotransferase [Methanosarcina sp. A14]
MKIYCIQHVEFETLGTIVEWIEKRNHSLSITRLYENQNFPSLDRFDLLIVMGGPMNIYEYEKYPWLRKEKTFLKEAISAGKAVLGICLGAQLIADALKAEVFKNNDKEIGWFPVFKIKQESKNPLLKGIPEEFIAFHWHGDTFGLPEGAIRLFESGACKNQGFIYKNRVIGLQFHLEMSNRTIRNVIENCRDELIEGTYIQNEEEMLDKDSFLAESKLLIFRMLDNIQEIVKNT